MPKATKEQIVTAVNNVLKEGHEKANLTKISIDNLVTEVMSDPGFACMDFSPRVLDQICKITNTLPNKLDTKTYDKDKDLPAVFDDGTFVNIVMLGQPSPLNHNFNILVSGEMTYLIQTFVDRQVNIVRRFANGDFIRHWHNLSNNNDWVGSYIALFGVAPNQVVDDLPNTTWLKEQHVSQ
jgi:hypothetical protein